MTCSIRLPISLAVLLAASTALGAAAPALEESKSLVRQAAKAYQLGQFAEASEGYRRAYELTPRPALLFNLAQCHRQLGEYERAAFFYRGFVNQAPAASNAAMARELLAEMEAKVQEAEQRRLEQERAEQSERARDEERARADRELAKRLAPEAPPPEVPAPLAHSKPLLKRWWFWAAVGATAAAAGASYAVLNRPAPQEASLGTVRF